MPRGHPQRGRFVGRTVRQRTPVSDPSRCRRRLVVGRHSNAHAGGAARGFGRLGTGSRLHARARVRAGCGGGSYGPLAGRVDRRGGMHRHGARRHRSGSASGLDGQPARGDPMPRRRGTGRRRGHRARARAASGLPGRDQRPSGAAGGCGSNAVGSWGRGVGPTQACASGAAAVAALAGRARGPRRCGGDARWCAPCRMGSGDGGDVEPGPADYLDPVVFDLD